MKLDRKFFEETMASSRLEQEKAKEVFHRHQGVINFCEYVLKNSDSLEGEKEPENGLVHQEAAGKQ